MESFYVFFFGSLSTFSNKSPSVSVVQENATALFLCGAPEMFVDYETFHQHVGDNDQLTFLSKLFF